jgi:hypothetical protein
VLVELPDDPEPQPALYTLRGLATSSAAVLILLAASLALVAALGLGIGEQDRRAPALIIGVLFAVATLGVLRALVIRMNVPRRFRAAAATRGRASVAVDTRIASASDQVLAIADGSVAALEAVRPNTSDGEEFARAVQKASRATPPVVTGDAFN